MLRRSEYRWQRVKPTLVEADAALTAVTSDPDDAIWAAGWSSVGGQPRPLILRQEGQRWQPTAIEQLPGGEIVVSDLDFRSAEDGYAVGYLVPAEATDHVPLLLRWDGSRWRNVELPWAHQHPAVLRAVAAGEGGALLIAGARVARNGGWTRGFLARSSAGGWEVRRADVNPYHNAELADAAFIDGRATVVGSHAGRAMLFEGCPGSEVDVAAEAAPDAKEEVGDAKAEPAASEAARPSHDAGASEPVETSRARRPAPTPDADTHIAPADEPAASLAVVFRDVADATGISEITQTYGGLAADLDGDGWPDLFYSRHNEHPPRLLLGGPGGFIEAPTDGFRDRDRHGCAAADVDADARLDLFCTHGAIAGVGMTSNELWLDPTGERRQATADFGLVDPFGRGRVAAFLRLDDDAHPELFVANRPQRADGLPSLSRLYRNDRGLRYLAAPEAGLDVSMGGRCALGADIDADGDDDLLVCADQRWLGPARGLRAFRNDGGTLTLATAELGLEPIDDVDVVMADLDGDGAADDLAQLAPDRLRLSLWDGSGFAQAFELPVSDGVAVAAGDADGDQVADLYVVQGDGLNRSDQLLLNAGEGRDFRSASIPTTSVGSADDVVALDHDRNGLTDFLVLNGRGSPGPVQLIAAFRAPPDAPGQSTSPA